MNRKKFSIVIGYDTMFLVLVVQMRGVILIYANRERSVHARRRNLKSIQIRESTFSISRTASRICSSRPVYPWSILLTMSTSMIVIASGYKKFEKTPRSLIIRSQTMLRSIHCVPIEALLSSQRDVIILNVPM